MKKLLCILMILAMSVCFVACADDKAPKKEVMSSSDSTVTNNISEIKNTDFGINETAVFENLKFTATEIKESKGVEYFEAESGRVFVGVKFTIENISSEEQAVSSVLSFEGYADDVKCEYTISAGLAFDEGTLDGDIAPGKKLVGWYAIEVPEDWSNIELLVKPDLISESTATFKFKK